MVINVLTGLGIPWLLGTDDAVRNKRVFINHSKQALEEMKSICPNLFNFVHEDNTVNIRWLKWLGFKFDEPEPIGKNGAMFRRFYIGKTNV